MIQRAFRIVCLGIFVLVLGLPVMAQNTKGDRPSPPSRETRFKTPKKSGQKRKPGRRVKQRADRAGQRAALPPGRVRKGERPGRPIRPTFERSRPSNKQKAWKGDITGRRIRPHTSASRARNVYPQPGTTNYSSRTLKRNARDNKNPNLRRVRRITQQHERAKARPGRPIRPVYINKRPRHQEKAWTGDITGRRIRSRVSDHRGEAERHGIVGAPGQTRPKARRIPSMAGRGPERARNYTRRKFYVNNQSQRPPGYRAPSNRSALMMLKRNPPPGPAQVKGGRIVPRSASAPYLRRRSTNVWARFRRPGHRQERAITKDLAGKKLRTKNFETRRPVLTNPTLKYQKRMATGERPYKGAAGGYESRRPGQKAWKGDVAHWPLRAGNAPAGRARTGKRVPGKTPGIGALGIGKYQGNIKTRRRGFGDQGEGYQGNIRARRSLKGGGSVSGRAWNNNGVPIQGRTPGKGSSGIGYQGNIKAGRRPLNDQGEGYTGNIKANRRRGFTDQGEEYSGNIKVRRGFNNQGEEYSGNIRLDRKRGFSDQGEEYTGNIRRRKGFNDQGEEYTGNIRRGKKAFNDQGEEYSGNIKVRRGFNDQGEEYTGNIKARRPEKGGGSVSGKVWNNRNTPIAGQTPRGQTQIARYQGNMKVRGRKLQDQGEEYTGNIRARRPPKGGGSVSGKLWNNNETPIASRIPKSQQGARFAGNMRISKSRYKRNPDSPDNAVPVYKEKSAQGTDFSGRMKLARSYRRNPNSDDDALRVHKDENQGADFGGNIRLARNRYRRNPNSADQALPVYRERNDQGGDFSGNMKIAGNRYRRNPNSAPSALPVLKPSNATAQASRHSSGVRRNWDYIRNPSASNAALHTREPGRAFARVTDYQGSIKLKKFDLFGKSDLHPDARFVRLNKNNVPEERDMITNFKLWWARLFRKNDTQPDHLKEKERKPRYDKGEEGMWYE